jgi:hypothetical protein
VAPPPGATGRAVFRRPAQIEVDSVELMPFAVITLPDVRRSGERDRESLRKRAATPARIADDTLLCRVEFHLLR